MSAASFEAIEAQRLVAALGDDAGASGGIARHDRLDLELADDVAALPERVDVALHRLDVAELGAARRHQLVMDRQEIFADDEQAGLRQQMMDVGDAAGHRVLDRDHAEVGFPRGDRGQRVLEGRAGQRLGVGIGFGDGDMGIGPRLALECDFQLFLVMGRLVSAVQAFASISRAVSRSAGVSTPRGTVSTMPMSIRIPASSARNCSSFSCISSGEGGSDTKRSSAARR